MIDLEEDKIDTRYMHKIFSVCKDEWEDAKDILDSLSPNQFKSKRELVSVLKDFGVLNDKMTVIVIGSWYGSIIIPSIAPFVKRVECIDIDEKALRISKRLFENEYSNVRWWSRDFTKPGETHDMFLEDNLLVINTSCEHMVPMKDFWANVKPEDRKNQPNVWFACQSNDMDWIDTHINCVQSTKEFEQQMPRRFRITYSDKIKDTRGHRFFLFGQIRPETNMGVGAISAETAAKRDALLGKNRNHRPKVKK